MAEEENDLLKEEDKTKFLGLRVSALFEITAFFIILSFVGLLFKLPINYYDVNPHPYWALVVLMAVQYGTREGLLAAFLSTVILLLGPLPVRNILQDKSTYFLLLAKTPLLWFVTAVILGELRLRQFNLSEKLRSIARESYEREKKVADSYSALKKLKERLEIHVASEMQTTLQVVTAFKELEEHSEQGEQGVIKGAIELTKTLVAPEKFSIFLLENGVLQCQAINGWSQKDNFKDHFEPDSPLYHSVIDERKTVSLYTSDPKILGSEGVLAVPIQSASEKRAFGMIKVEEIPVTRLNTSTIETLHLIGEWIGKSYSHYLLNRAPNAN